MRANIPTTTGFLSVLGLFLAGCGSSQLDGQPARSRAKGPNLVAQQQKFCQIILDGVHEVGRLSEQAGNERNPIRHDALEQQAGLAEDKVFDALYTLVGPSGEFTGWRGQVTSFSRPDDKGRMHIAFRTECGSPETPYMATGDVPSQGNTDVLLSSPLGQTVANLDLSKGVTVSGTFIWTQRGHWPYDLPILDRHHFHPAGGESMARLSMIRVMVRFTSIAQAR